MSPKKLLSSFAAKESTAHIILQHPSFQSKKSPCGASDFDLISIHILY